MNKIYRLLQAAAFLTVYMFDEIPSMGLRRKFRKLHPTAMRHPGVVHTVRDGGSFTQIYWRNPRGARMWCSK